MSRIGLSAPAEFVDDFLKEVQYEICEWKDYTLEFSGLVLEGKNTGSCIPRGHCKCFYRLCFQCSKII